MAKAGLKKEVTTLIEKGKVPKRVNGKMGMATDEGEILITKLAEEMVAYDFIAEGRRVTAVLGPDAEAPPAMKESKIPEAKPVEDAAPKEAKVPKVKAVKEPLVPVMVEQKDEKGNVEQVDFNLYKNIITCIDCGELRYVKDADRHQVTRCKPHARKARRQRIRASRKARGVGKKTSFVEGKKAEKAAAKA
jgi:hypothetical protein